MAHLNILVYITFIYLLSFSSCKNKHADRVFNAIVGGKQILKYAPFMAYISSWDMNGTLYHCAGNVIASQWILTTASCIYERDLNKSLVYVGADRTTSGEKCKIQNVYLHRRYPTRDSFIYYPRNQEPIIPDVIRFDIALIKLTTPIVNEKIKPIELNTMKVPFGSNGTIVGWLFSYEGDVFNNGILEYGAIETIKCDQDDSPMLICATTAGGTSMCDKDTGGPFLIDSKLAGILSTHEPCREPLKALPNIYINVSYFNYFISDTMRDN